MDDIIQTFDEMYEDCLWKALKYSKNATQAAGLLGISVRQVERWKKRYGIYYDPDVGRYRRNPLKRKQFDKERKIEKLCRKQAQTSKPI